MTESPDREERLVSTSDFEIKTSIGAKRLVARVPPNAQTQVEGEEVRLIRHEQRNGVPEAIEASEPYSDVVIDKRIAGEMRPRRADDDATGRGGQVAREAGGADGLKPKK
jgi:hypothetical protein